VFCALPCGSMTGVCFVSCFMYFVADACVTGKSNRLFFSSAFVLLLKYLFSFQDVNTNIFLNIVTCKLAARKRSRNK
jgi:hypothetical protein